MRALPSLAALMMTLALTFAQAHHCSTWTTSTSTDDMTVVPGPFLLFDYLVVDHPCEDPGVEQTPSEVRVWFGHEFARVPLPVTVHAGCEHVGYWLYIEANGIPGVQRTDESVDDTCHGLVDGDHFVF